MNNPLAVFCASFTWIKSPTFTWLDRSGFLRLDDGRIVRTELSLHGTPVADRFNGFFVRIIHPVSGEIDAKFFAFDDYLSSTERLDDRVTGRNQYPLHGNPCYIADRQGWYIAKPADTRPLCMTIESYIDLFR